MSKINYMTLAAVRRANPKVFDNAIKRAFHLAVQDVGKEVFIKSVSYPQLVENYRKVA